MISRRTRPGLLGSGDGSRGGAMDCPSLAASGLTGTSAPAAGPHDADCDCNP